MKHCVFCKKNKDEVPALVTSEQGVTVCSLCLEDCLALFCEEGEGITRFIVAQIDADGEVIVFFPRAKNRIFVETAVRQAIDFSRGALDFISKLPFFFSRQVEVKNLEAKLASFTKDKKNIENALAAIKLQIEILHKRLERLST